MLYFAVKMFFVFFWNVVPGDAYQISIESLVAFQSRCACGMRKVHKVKVPPLVCAGLANPDLLFRSPGGGGGGRGRAFTLWNLEVAPPEPMEKRRRGLHFVTSHALSLALLAGITWLPEYTTSVTYLNEKEKKKKNRIYFFFLIHFLLSTNEQILKVDPWCLSMNWA